MHLALAGAIRARRELYVYYIGPSNKYIFRVGVGDILILLTV
jgi:hypothetical protein